MKWFEEKGYRTFGTLGEYGENEAPVIPLTNLLNIDLENVKPFTKDILDLEKQSGHFQSSINELSRGVHAYFQFQDILDVTLDPKDGEIVNRHYAYYESLVYLREGIASWLDGNVLSAFTLLRPFQEISILHLYWYLSCRYGTYEPYYRWLRDTRIKPSFLRTLYYVCNNLPSKSFVTKNRLNELKRILEQIYKSTHEYHHITNMKDSTVAQSGGLGNISLEYFLTYLESINILLYQITFLFVLTYPMSLFPVERYKKWAFSQGPVGLFFDKTNYAVLEGYLGSQNINTLSKSLTHNDDVKSLLDWFQSFPDLTPEEIDADWEKTIERHKGLNKEYKNKLGYRIMINKSINRSRNWALNYIVKNKEEPNMSDETMEQLRKRVRNW